MTPSMHQKPTEYGKYYVQNNQLPTETPIELQKKLYDSHLYVEEI